MFKIVINYFRGTRVKMVKETRRNSEKYGAACYTNLKVLEGILLKLKKLYAIFFYLRYRVLLFHLLFHFID